MADPTFMVDARGTAWPVDSEDRDLPGWDPVSGLNRFMYHPPTPAAAAMVPAACLQIRTAVLEVAEVLNVTCPLCQERTIALIRLEEVVFWADAAVARHGRRSCDVGDLQRQG